jgi:hypothetical protein
MLSSWVERFGRRTSSLLKGTSLRGTGKRDFRVYKTYNPALYEATIRYWKTGVSFDVEKVDLIDSMGRYGTLAEKLIEYTAQGEPPSAVFYRFGESIEYFLDVCAGELGFSTYERAVRTRLKPTSQWPEDIAEGCEESTEARLTFCQLWSWNESFPQAWDQFLTLVGNPVGYLQFAKSPFPAMGPADFMEVVRKWRELEEDPGLPYLQHGQASDPAGVPGAPQFRERHRRKAQLAAAGWQQPEEEKELAGKAYTSLFAFFAPDGEELDKDLPQVEGEGWVPGEAPDEEELGEEEGWGLL